MKTHYVYKITDPKTGQFYIGSRTCDCKPENDTGYLGSMITWNPEDENRLQKEIIKNGFDDREGALEYEAKLIEQHIDNELNENYYIPTKGFHTTGKQEVAKKISMSHKKRWKRLTHHLKGKTWEGVYGKDDVKQRKEFQSLFMRENNPMYNKNTVNIISRKLKDYYKLNEAPFLNKTHSNKAKNKMSDIRKKWWDDADDDILEERSRKLSKNKKEWHKNNPDALIGAKNPAAKKVLCECCNKKFQTLTECAKYHNKTVANISAHCNGKYKTQKFKFVK